MQQLSRRSHRAFAATLGIVALVTACAHVHGSPESGSRKAGVGLVLARRGALSVVAELVPGSPAVRTGILPGDVLSAIDGMATAGRPISEVAALLNGPSGSRVDLLLARQQGVASQAISIIREPVSLLAVESSLLDDVTLYIRIRSFLSNTPADVAAALGRAEHAGRTLILDVRSNSGGKLESVVRTAELFLARGTRIGTVESVPSSTGETFVSETEPIADFDQVFILVNQDTAAGAELFSLALRAGANGMVVGERTFGFATVETRWSEPGRRPRVDGVLRGPRGETFDGIGIEPDIVAPVDPSLVYPPQSDPLLRWLMRRDGTG